MTEYQNVLVEIDGPVATITLNRPEQLNAMSTGLLDDLYAALRDLNPGDDVRGHPPARRRAGVLPRLRPVAQQRRTAVVPASDRDKR